MADPSKWLEVLAWSKALFESTKAGIDFAATLQKNREDGATIRESERASQSYSSTYSDDELDAILKRLKGCRDRFIQQGGGIDRSRCLCSVLNEMRDGNGGRIPRVDDWERIYSELKCGKVRD